MVKQKLTTSNPQNDLLDSLELNPLIGESVKDSNRREQERAKYLAMTQNDVYDAFCSSLHCDIGPMSKDESAIIRLRFRIWSRSLAIVSIYLIII